MELLSWWAVVVALVSFLGGILFAVAAILCLPFDFFSERRTTTRSLPWKIVKNVVGIVLVVIGIALLFMPGQGLLTIVIGLALIDFPGRHALVKKFVARPRFLDAANQWRARFGRPPLEAP